MEIIPVYDNLNFKNDNNISKIVGQEKIFYSGKITKYNNFNVGQERNFMITSKAVYNLKKVSLKRRFEIKSIKGITKSKKSDGFIIHGGDSEYDYYFDSPDKIIIIIILAKVYEIICGHQLKISEIDKSHLKSFVTTKKEKNKKDINFSKMDQSQIIDIHSILTDKYEKFKDLFPKTNNIENNNNNILNNNPISFIEITYKTIFSNHEIIKDINLDNLKIIKILGRGVDGKVLLVKLLKNNKYYAMKSINKKYFYDKENLIQNKILERLDFIFLIKVIFCFETNNRIFFIMDLVKYGELYNYLKLKNYFDEFSSKFYISIIGLALDYLHKNGLKYRNIKPESILFDEDGYLKIVSFGLDKLIKNDEENSNSDIFDLSPEVIQNKESTSNDWWILGVILYEMLFGIPPFYDKNPEPKTNCILNNDVQFPNDIKVSDSAKDLILKLLNKEYDKRLGFNNGFDEIKSHEFFKDINFDDLLNKKIKAPYKPNLMINLQNIENIK